MRILVEIHGFIARVKTRFAIRKLHPKYNLSDAEMFEYFNKPALDDAIRSGKNIKFSHNPLEYGKSALVDEWEYLKEKLKLTDDNLVLEGGIWYVK